MLDIPVPYGRLLMFIDKLKLDEKDMDRLKSHARAFTEKKGEFAEFFFNAFFEIPETRMILERHEKGRLLKKIWEQWFESLILRGLERAFHNYLWQVGLRHVDIGLDQRFSNLGFSLVRQFCHGIILSEIPEGERTEISVIIDRLIDLCVLIETSAFIEASTRCEREVIKGIADKVRNPVTVIGGNIQRLKKKADPESTVYRVYEDLILETSRLEQMVFDIKTYNEMYERDPEYSFVLPEAAIRTALERLMPRVNELKVKVEMSLGSSLFVKADRKDMDQLFYYILQNCLDAVDKENPLITINGRPGDTPPNSIVLEVFNTGIPPKEEDLHKLFSPFFSTKPGGTGLGLPIARLALRRNFGNISVTPVSSQGTKVTIVLPAAS